MLPLLRSNAVCTQDKLESVLDVSHQQMEQYRAQPAHAEKIAYQQKLLQEDVVHIRAEISQVSTVSQEGRDGRPAVCQIRGGVAGLGTPHLNFFFKKSETII